MNDFINSVKAFNLQYGLPVRSTPGLPFKKIEGANGEPGPTLRQQLFSRLVAFQTTLQEELDEGTEIAHKVAAGDPPIEILTDLADWLGDIQIYCMSEMIKFGLDPTVVLGIIMASNRSKLGADGKPIYDSNGKVLKGPNYWRPEPQIRRYIEAAWRQSCGGDDSGTDSGEVL